MKMDKQEKAIKHFYDSVGHRTQRRQYKTPEIEDYHAAENRLLMSFVSEGDRVLDIGCGEGRQLEILALKTQRTVIGVDFSTPALDVAKQRANGTAVLIHADAKQIPIYNAHFDKITLMFNTLGTMPKKQQVMREAHRLLKPGGQVLVSVYSPEALPYQLDLYRKAGWKVVKHTRRAVHTREGLVSMRFKLQEVKELLQGAGFKDIVVSLLTPIAVIGVGSK